MARWKTMAMMASVTLAAGLVQAAETITYGPDATARLVSQAGTVNDGVPANDGFDKADGRKAVTATGAL